MSADLRKTIPITLPVLCSLGWESKGVKKMRSIFSPGFCQNARERRAERKFETHVLQKDSHHPPCSFSGFSAKAECERTSEHECRFAKNDSHHPALRSFPRGKRSGGGRYQKPSLGGRCRRRRRMRDKAALKVRFEKALLPSSKATASARFTQRRRTIPKAFPWGKVPPQAADEGQGSFEGQI